MTLQKKFKLFFLSAIYFQISVLVISLFFIESDLYLAGSFMGKFAIYTFWLIALAGILKRFKVEGILKKIQIVLTTNRRQLGILMFFLALTHYMWNVGFSVILYGPPTSIPLFQIFGLIALILTIPLVITSNNYSVKKLGKFWKILHTLVYPIMFLLVLHTSMQGNDFQIFGLDFGLDYAISYAIPSLIILLLQILSYTNIRYNWFLKKQPS